MSLPKTMRALVMYGKGDYRYEKAYPTPECGPDDIIVKSEGSGICAGDLKCYHGSPMHWGGDLMEQYAKPPAIPGHEFVGTIAEIGANVKGYKIGERVLAEQIVPCNDCRFCKTGKYWMCQTGYVFGFSKDLNGGMAEYVRFPKNAIIHRVPADMPLDKALLIEPYACSKHCVDRAQIDCGDTVVLSGAGTLGLGMITYARLKNPKNLVVLDMRDERLEKALEFGADTVINPGKEDAVKRILDMTEGYGCDTYIEATGNPASVLQGMNMVRKLGRFVEFSVFGAPTTFDWSMIGDRKELDVLGAHLGPYCYPYVIDAMYNNKLKTDNVVTTFLPLEQWERGFELAAGKEGDIKVALTI